MSYPYAASHSPMTSTYPPAASAYSAGGAPAAPYPHSPYAAPAAAPHSPYAAPAAYPHSPYAGSTLSAGTGTTLAPGSSSYHSAAPSPRAGYTYLPAGTTSTAPAGGQFPVGHATAQAGVAQPFGANVQAGAVTYTTTTDALGRVTYHHFKAEPSLYRSPQGVTYTGIQWVPTETSTSPPIGIIPAGPDVLASFRGQLPISPESQPAAGRDYRDEKAYRETEKEEYRRRKREDKEAAKRTAAWEAERRAREVAEEKEIRKARERDAQREVEAERASRIRRLSTGAGLGAGLAPAAYERSRSRERPDLRERELRERDRSRERDLERRMGDLNMGSRGLMADYSAPPVGTRSRRQSMSMPMPGGVYDEPGSYEREPERERERDGYDNRRSSIYGAPERASSMYGGPERTNNIYGAPERMSNAYNAPDRSGSVYAAPERSPYRRSTSPLPPAMGPGGVPVYPAGHIYEGQPISGAPGGALSRSHSPALILGTASCRSTAGGPSPRLGGGGIAGLSPRMGGGVVPGLSPRLGGMAPLAGAGAYGASQQENNLLASPEAFSRPINRAQTFTPFNMLKVQDMDDFLVDVITARPPVLGTHDVQPEDWGRLMNDLALAWKGHLPLPNFSGGAPPKRSALVIDLLDLWNAAFFLARGVELVLYKGRSRISGRGARMPETKLESAQLESSSDSYSSETGSSDEGSDLDDLQHDGGGYGNYGIYGRKGGAHDRSTQRKQKMEQKVRREMERQEELKRKYTLWLTYIPPQREY